MRRGNKGERDDKKSHPLRLSLSLSRKNAADSFARIPFLHMESPTRRSLCPVVVSDDFLPAFHSSFRPHDFPASETEDALMTVA